jgi:hypothetical protein
MKFPHQIYVSTFRNLFQLNTLKKLAKVSVAIQVSPTCTPNIKKNMNFFNIKIKRFFKRFKIPIKIFLKCLIVCGGQTHTGIDTKQM